MLDTGDQTCTVALASKTKNFLHKKAQGIQKTFHKQNCASWMPVRIMATVSPVLCWLPYHWAECNQEIVLFAHLTCEFRLSVCVCMWYVVSVMCAYMYVWWMCCFVYGVCVWVGCVFVVCVCYMCYVCLCAFLVCICDMCAYVYAFV